MRFHDSSKAYCQRTKKLEVAQLLYPFPKIVGIILPLISPCDYPAQKKLIRPPSETTRLSLCDGPHSVCEVFLNKPTSYLPFCLSLNSFCDETLRTWTSLPPETTNHGFWLGWVPTSWVRVSNWVFAGFRSHPAHGLKSQPEVNSFGLTKQLQIKEIL